MPTDVVPIALRLPAHLDALVRARAEERGTSRHQAIVDAIAEGLGERDLEAAVEVVLLALEERDHHELAMAAAAATDPATDAERAANIEALRKMRRSMGW